MKKPTAKELNERLIQAFIDYMKDAKFVAFAVLIPDTSPQLYIAGGEAPNIIRLLEPGMIDGMWVEVQLNGTADTWYIGQVIHAATQRVQLFEAQSGGVEMVDDDDISAWRPLQR